MNRQIVAGLVLSGIVSFAASAATAVAKDPSKAGAGDRSSKRAAAMRQQPRQISGRGAEPRPVNLEEASRMAALAAEAGGRAVFVPAVAMGVSAPVSSFEALDPTKPLPTRSRFFPDAEGKERGRPEGEEGEKMKETVSGYVAEPDGALDQNSVLAMPAPIITFDGSQVTDNGVTLSPPDTNGAVGPNHYVQTVNLVVRIHNKATGATLAGPFLQSSLYSSIPASPCASNDDGDPIVQYDKLADRWVISQFYVSTAPSHQCIAVSQTGDPTGAWFVYDFVLPGTVGATTEPYFQDYPHLGTWPDGYYMSTNQFNQAGTAFYSGGFFAFDRTKMLAGLPAGLIYFDSNKPPFVAAEGIGGALPSDFDGRTVPPAGAPNMFMLFTTTQWGDPAYGLRLFEFHADFANPAFSTLTELTTYAVPLPVAPFRIAGTSSERVGQPGTATGLDTLSDRLMHRLQYRKFAGYESWVVTHSVDWDTVTAGYQGGIRYYEIRRTPAGTGGTIAIPETATYAPADGLSRWMGSAAMDHQGNLSVGYSSSSAAAFPSLRYAGRLAGDPANSLAQGEAVLFAGSGSQTGSSRWGDYSALQIDPLDDCTFWFTSEYYAASASVAWKTRIGSYKFPGCTTPAQGTLTGTITNCSGGLPVPGAIVTLDNGMSATTNAAGVYSFTTLPPATYTATVTKPGFGPAGSGSLGVTNGGTTTFNACLTGAPVLAYVSTAITGGDGDGQVDADECNSLTITVGNSGFAAATAVTGTLSTSTAGVSIFGSPTRSFPDIATSGTGANTTAFQLSTAPGFVAGTTIALQLQMSFTGGGSPLTLNFSIPTLGGGYAATTGTLAIDPGTSLVSGSQADDAFVAIALPFPYSFYGANFTSVNASTNGNLQFSSSSTAFSNAALPSATVNNAILPFWDDLDMRTTTTACATANGGPCGIYTSTTGTLPNRVFTIEWRAVRFAASGPWFRVNLAVRLYEGQQKMDFVYNNDVAGTSGNGDSATIGIQQGTGTAFSQHSFNSAAVSAAPFSITYTYNTPAPGPGICAVLPTLLSDGFESGSTSQWSAKQP